MKYSKKKKKSCKKTCDLCEALPPCADEAKDFTCKKGKCKKKYSDEKKQQCKKTCELCEALPPSAPPPVPMPSTETVELTLTASGVVSDYSDTSSLQQGIATAAGVHKSLVTINVAAASVIITAAIVVPAATPAATVLTSLTATVGSPAAASAALGITVESITVMAYGSWWGLGSCAPPSSPPPPMPSPPPPSPSPPPPSPSPPPPSPPPPPPSPPPPSPPPPSSPTQACTYTFTTKASLKTAVQAFNANPTTATATFGPIASWCVSAITDMGYLFYNLQNINADISSWETSSVTDMNGMFYVRSSPCPAPNLQSSPSCTLLAPRSSAASRAAPRPARCALLSTLGSTRRRSTSR